MKNVRKNSIELTREDLKTASESRRMESSKNPATEPSKQAPVTRHEPLVYRVEEVAQLLAISNRARTTCATARKISKCCALAPASG